jgi:hypothetical protein
MIPDCRNTRGASSERPVFLSGLLRGVLLLALSSLVASAQVRPPFAWSPLNFDTTVAGNYRGARLTSKAQLDSLRAHYGIRTVINLAKDALPKTGASEIQWTKELGIEYISVYLGTQPPSSEQWKRIRERLSQGGVYVHCAHGADRTGAIIARYRTEIQGLSADAAYREARRYGFKPWLADLKKWMLGM